MLPLVKTMGAQIEKKKMRPHLWTILMPIYNYMAEAHKKQKGDKSRKGPDFSSLYDNLVAASMASEDHPFVPLLEAIRTSKKPILQVVSAQNDVYKSNP